MLDLKPYRYHTEHPTAKKYVWYKEHRKISDYIRFGTNDLINPTGKRITKKSRPLLNVGMGFDCETSRISDSSDISCVYIWQFSIGNYNFLCRDFKSVIRFTHELSKLIKDLHPNAYAIIFDANIKYEFSYFEELFSSYITDIFAKSTTDICSFTLLNNLKFQECLGVFGTSLENLAKNYTTTKKRKGDLNYNKIRNSHTHMSRKEILYSVNDVAILSELLHVAIDMFISKGFKIPLTQTGIVRQEIKHSMLSRRGDKERYIESVNALIGNKDEYITFREFLYSGGLTHSNYKYVGMKLTSGSNTPAVKCKDLTSAYPWAMNNFSFPAGKLVHTDDIRFALKHKHYILKLTFANIRSKSTHSTISEHKCVKLDNPTIDNGRVLRADTLTLWVNEIDLSNIKLIYDYDKEHCYINDVYYFTDSKRCPQSMLNVMNEWYIKKTHLKPLTKDKYANTLDYDNNCKEYMRLKQLINSCYGMLVTSLYFENTVYENNRITTQHVSYDDAKKTIFNPYIGYWVTARVRERLIQVIAKYPDNIVQYDTDSLYYIPTPEIEDEFSTINDNIYAQITKVCPQSELHDLGQWDDDGEYTEFCGYGSKRYCGKHADGTYKITFAGANKKDILKESTRLNIEMFDYLKDFSIDTAYSNKKGAVHPHKDFKAGYYTVTDYNGNTSEQYICGYTTIVNVQFKAHLTQQFENLRKTFNKGVHNNEY